MAAPHRRPVTNPFANRGGPSSSRRVGYTDHRYGSNQNLQNRGRRGLSCSPLCCCICILTMFGVISVFFGFPSNQKYHYDDNDTSSLLNAKNGFATADERRTPTIDQSIKQYSSYQPKKNEHPERADSHDRSGDNDNNQESASAEEDQKGGFRNRNNSNEKITVGSQRSESEENELEEDEAHHVFQKIVEKRKDSEENNETGSEDNQMNTSEDDNTGDYKKRTNGNENSNNDEEKMTNKEHIVEGNDREEDHVFQKNTEKRKNSEEEDDAESGNDHVNTSKDDNTGSHGKRINDNENSNNNNNKKKMTNKEHIVKGSDGEEDHVFEEITGKRKNSEEEEEAGNGDDQVNTSEDDNTGSHGKRINDNENSNDKNDDKMNDNEHIIVVEGNDGEDQDKKYHQNTDIELHVEYHDLDSNESQTVLSNGTSHGIYGDISTNETKRNKVEAKEEFHKVKESKDDRVVAHQIYVDKDEEGMHKKHAHDKKGPYYILDVSSNTSIVNEENTGEGNNTSTLIDIITESVNISKTTVSSIVEDDEDDDDKNLTSSTLVNQTVPINPTMSTNTIYHPSDNETEIASTETNVNEIRIIDTILNSSKYVNIDINSSTNNDTTSETLSLSNQTSLKDNVTEVEDNALSSVHNSESTTTTAIDASVITTTTNRMNETIIVIPEGNILKNHTSSRTEVKSNALSSGSLLNNQISEGRTNKATSSEVDEPINGEEKDVKNGNLRGSTTRR